MQPTQVQPQQIVEMLPSLMKLTETEATLLLFGIRGMVATRKENKTDCLDPERITTHTHT